MKTKLYIINILSIISIVNHVFAQEYVISTFNSRCWAREIKRLDIKTDSMKLIYKSSNNGSIYDSEIKESSKTAYIAFTENGDWQKDIKGAYYTQRKLVIIDIAGSILSEYPNGQALSWSPDGKQLVYISGIKYEGFSFKAESLFVVSIEGNTRKFLSVAKNDQDIIWAKHDGMVYTTNYQNVFKYNPENGQREVTNFKGIHFSPDGQFYFKPNYEGTDIGVYESASNKDITIKYINKYVNYIKWFPEENHLLVVGDFIKEKKIIDMGTSTIYSTIPEGIWVGYNKNKQEIILNKKGNILKVRR